MKILMLCDFFDVNQQYQENLLAKYYSYLGHEVIVIASTYTNVFDFVANKYKYKPEHEEDFEYGKLYRLPYRINLIHKLKVFSGVRRIILKENPDLIFSHDISLNLHDAVYYKKRINKDCKIIMDYHADYSNSGKNWISINILHKLIRKQYLKSVKKYIQNIFPVVPESAVFLNEIYNIPYQSMELLPLGYDVLLAEEATAGLNEIELKEKYNISPDNIVIITGGKLEPLKKTEVLLEALSMNANKERISLIIFGAAHDNFQDYYQKLKELSKNISVHFVGWISAKESMQLMSISDVAIFPSSQSVLWQQAIGMGLPLIVGDLGRQDPSYLNKNNNVVVIPTDNINAAAFSEAIDEILIDDNLINMKKGARKTADEYLSYIKIAKDTLV